MLEPSQLPAGVHAEVNEDLGTIDIINLSDKDVMIGNVVKLKPGERVAFVVGRHANCTITGHRYRRP